MSATPIALIVVLSASLASARAGQEPSTETHDGKRELTISGCLLRSGYAGYQIDDAKIDAIDGKPSKVSAASAEAIPKKWILEGGGNLGRRVGEKVEVIGRSDWRASPSTNAADEPPAKAPVLDVKSVKTITSRCS